MIAIVAGFDDNANLGEVALLSLYSLSTARLAFNAQHSMKSWSYFSILFTAISTWDLQGAIASAFSPLMLVDFFVAFAVPLLTSIYLIPLIHGDIIQTFSGFRGRGSDGEVLYSSFL